MGKRFLLTNTGPVRFSDSLPPRVGFARRLVQVIRLPHQGLSICPLACSIVFFFSGLRGGSRESARHKPPQSRMLSTFEFSSTRSSVVSCIPSHLRTHLPAGETISKNWECNKGTAHAHAVKRFSLRLICLPWLIASPPPPSSLTAFSSSHTHIARSPHPHFLSLSSHIPPSAQKRRLKHHRRTITICEDICVVEGFNERAEANTSEHPPGHLLRTCLVDVSSVRHVAPRERRGFFIVKKEKYLIDYKGGEMEKKGEMMKKRVK